MAEFNNPQQEPGMERKLLLVFALTFLVIMLFQPILKKYGPQPAATPQTANQTANQTQASSGATTGGVATPGASAAAGTTPAGKSASSSSSATKQAAAEAETVIENGLYRIVFTNRGGQVKSWVLKNYKDVPNGKPLDLVNATAAAKYGYPLSLWTYDEALRNKVNSGLYVVSSTSSTAPAEITFEYSDGDVSVQKKFKFDHSYVVGIETSVLQKGVQVTAFPMWPSGFGGETTSPSYAATEIAYQYDSKVQRLAIKKISGGGTLN
ncbi:MAG: membrane protein insertase YidC, partial [Terriglobales bacterium]